MKAWVEAHTRAEAVIRGLGGPNQLSKNNPFDFGKCQSLESVVRARDQETPFKTNVHFGFASFSSN